MANETTTTSANDITYSAIIVPALLATLAEQVLPMSWCREYDITGEPSNAADIPYADSDFGSANDRGAGVDTEFDATQGTELSNTQWSTSKYSISAAEYGIAYEVTYNVLEDSVRGIDIYDAIFGHMTRALGLAWSDDFCALLPGLSQSVGTSGAAATVANMLAAQTGIRRRGGIAEDGLVYVLGNQQVDDLEGALVATNAAAAVYATAADRILAAGPGPNNGMGAGRQVLSFRGYPVHASGLVDTANGSVDEVGACFTPSGPRNDPFATFGNVIKRAALFETDRKPRKRTVELVLTMRMGAGELHDATGTKIVTRATA